MGEPIAFPTKGKKSYCAICKKEIIQGNMFNLYSTKNGTLKITHYNCGGEE